MKTTLTFTEQHIDELKRISSLGVFASKIAETILSKEVYKASVKQVDILNQVSEIEFYISDDVCNDFYDENRKKQRNLFYK